MRYRSFPAIIGALIVSILLSGTFPREKLPALADTPAAGNEPAKPLSIGIIVPLSGPAAFYGVHLRNGIELAYDGLPAEKRTKIELHFEDDQFDAKLALSAYQKLVYQNHVDVLVLFGSGAGYSVLPAASREGKTSFIFTVDPKVTVGQQRAFRIALEADTQATLLDALLQKRGIRRVALLSTANEAMLQYTKTMKEVIERRGGEVVYNQDFTKGEQDFKTVLLSISQKHADATVVSLLPPSLSAFLKQRREALPKLPSFGYAQVENAPEIAASQGAADGTIFSGLALTPEFNARYRAKFHDEAGSFAGYTYEILRRLSDAQAQGAKSAEDISAAFASETESTGVFGRYRRRPDNSYEVPAALLEVRGGKIEEYREENS